MTTKLSQHFSLSHIHTYVHTYIHTYLYNIARTVPLTLACLQIDLMKKMNVGVINMYGNYHSLEKSRKLSHIQSCRRMGTGKILQCFLKQGRCRKCWRERKPRWYKPRRYKPRWYNPLPSETCTNTVTDIWTRKRWNERDRYLRNRGWFLFGGFLAANLFNKPREASPNADLKGDTAAITSIAGNAIIRFAEMASRYLAWNDCFLVLWRKSCMATRPPTHPPARATEQSRRSEMRQAREDALYLSKPKRTIE